MHRLKQFLTPNSKVSADSEPYSAVVTAPSNSGVASNYENHLSLLLRYDVVLLVDDSGSMSGSRWKEARKALQALATEASKYDEDGIEIQFLNSSEVLTTKDPNAVKSLFERINPAGYTPLGTKISHLLDEYMERFKAGPSELKPVIYIVITDGEASDGQKTEQAVIRTARALDEAQAKPDQIGIQFVQIGNDSNATEYLQMLDNTLTSRAGIRDMVDTTPSKPGEKIDLLKALLGSVNRRVDRKGSAALIGGR